MSPTTDIDSQAPTIWNSMQFAAEYLCCNLSFCSEQQSFQVVLKKMNFANNFSELKD